MIIKHSKFLFISKMLIILLIISILSSSPLIFFINSLSMLDFLEIILKYSLGISVVVLVLISMVFKPDIEVKEKLREIGGMPNLRHSPDTLLDVFGKRQFVAECNVDIKASLKQSFIEQAFGIYTIYDHNRRSFRVYKSFFTKNEFDLIRQKLDSILGIEIQ